MNPPPIPSKPIDVLILDTLALGKLVTPSEIAAMWGEDCARVYGWLEKFRKAGLCHLRIAPTRGLNLKKIAYIGLPDPIAEYLKSRMNGRT